MEQLVQVKKIHRSEILPGDTIKCEWESYGIQNAQTTKVLWVSDNGKHVVNERSITMGWDWETADYYLVDRPVKPLPTEPGSAIDATEVRGVTGKWRMFLLPDGMWDSSDYIDKELSHFPTDITEWEPAVWGSSEHNNCE